MAESRHLGRVFFFGFT